MDAPNSGSRAKRLLLEGAVIVVSILLAFAIDAWWDQQEEGARRVRLLEDLLVETRQNMGTVEGQLEVRAGLNRVTERLVGFSLNGVPSDLSADSLDRLILGSGWYENLPVGTASVDAVVQSGNLRLLENEALLRALTEWREVVRNAELVVASDRDFTLGPYTDLLNREGESLQIFRQVPPDLPDGYPVPEYPASDRSFDHTAMVRSREFRNLLATKRSISADLEFVYAQLLLPTARSLVALLETELGVEPPAPS